MNKKVLQGLFKSVCCLAVAIGSIFFLGHWLKLTTIDPDSLLMVIAVVVFGIVLPLVLSMRFAFEIGMAESLMRNRRE